MSSFLDEIGLGRLLEKIKNTFVLKANVTAASTLGIDQAPTTNSNNLVTSGGVKSALDNKINISDLSTSVSENDTNPVSGGAVYSKIENLIGSAPAALDTLGEISTALNNDANLAGTLTTQISQKIPKVTSPTANNFASFNSDGTIKDSGYSHLNYVTSVNGMTGAVTIDMSLSQNYEISDDTDDLNLESGDTYETAFSKLEKAIIDNEQIMSFALNDLNSRINNINIPTILQNITSADNGKILMVVDGELSLVSPSQIYSGNGTPTNTQGNNGDLFIQTD